MITIYSTPRCPGCDQAKEFFKKNDLEYVEHDVSKDPGKHNEMVYATGQLAVPVIKIEYPPMVGFNESKLREIFKI